MTAELRTKAQVTVEGGAAGAAELGRLEQGLNKVDTAQKRVANSAGQMRAATANLGQQIGDISQGFAAGTPLATIYAQQIGQVAFAASGMGGAIGKVGAFLSGPWGAALTGATILLGALAAGHSRAGDGADKQGEAENTLSQALKELDAATGISNRSTAENIRLSARSAEQSLITAARKRDEAQATLNAARANLTAARADEQVGGAKGLNFGSGFVTSAAEKAASKALKDLDELQAAFDKGTLDRAASITFGRAAAAARALVDPLEKIRQKYDAYDAALRASSLSGAQLTNRLAASYAARKAAEDGVASASKASTAATKAATAETRANSAALREAERDATRAAEASKKLADATKALFSNNRGPTVGSLRSGEGLDANGGVLGADLLSQITGRGDRDLETIGKKAADGFKAGALADAAAIGQAIGGSAGQVFSSISALGFGTKGPKGITGDLTGVGGKLTSLLQPLGDVFGSGGKKFAGLVGQAAGGAATGSVVSGIGDALGIKNSKIGASIGGAIGSFIPIPGGELIGSLLGGLLPGLLGSKPKGSTTVSASGGKIGQSSTGDKAIQKATGQLGNSISDAIQAIADQLGAGIGDFSVSIGKDGDRFRVDTTGQGRTKKNNTTVLGFDTDEGAALAAAIADALKDGAIKSSPRVQAALTAYGDNVNKAVAEALKVKGLEDLLADRKNPFATAFRTLEAQLKQRVDVASKYGFDLVEIEKVNGEDRARAVKDTLQAATGSVRALLNELTFGSKATGSPSERLAGLNAERDRLSGLVRGGDTSQLDAIASVIQQIDDLQKEAFGKTAGFATGRAENVSLLNDLVKQTEDRIKAAADAARAGTDATVDKLTEANASLDDLVNGQLITNARLADLAKLYGGSGGGFSFALSGEVARV